MSTNKRLEELREDLASLEHEQWAHWTEYMLKNYGALFGDHNRARWEKQIRTPYSKLSEKEKDSDREWADKVIALIKKKLSEKKVKGEPLDAADAVTEA